VSVGIGLGVAVLAGKEFVGVGDLVGRSSPTVVVTIAGVGVPSCLQAARNIPQKTNKIKQRKNFITDSLTSM
jgi:hypothetical protein